MSCVQGLFRQDFTCRTIRSKNDNFHSISFLVFYLHNQVMLFPMRRDSFVMTTTCGHHKERGLRGPFWDSFPNLTTVLLFRRSLFVGKESSTSSNNAPED